MSRRRAPAEFVPPGSRDGDLGGRIVSDQRWREGFDEFRRSEGRDPEAERQAYIDFLKELAP
jgi:hypothetical protein